MAEKEQEITETSPGYERRIVQWNKVRDALEGEEVVKDRGSTYLPKPKGMTRANYNNYLDRADFYAVTDRTLRGLTGLVFRVDPVFNLPVRIEPMEEVASPEGFTLRQLIREAEREVLSLGRYGLLVDMPEGGDRGSIPYIATWKAEDIFRWEEMVNPRTGVRRLTRVVVREEPAESGDQTLTYLRELFIDTDGAYKQQRWVEIENEKTVRRGGRAKDTSFITGNFEELGPPIIPSRFGKPLEDIPFLFINTFDMRSRTEKPPFIDLVNKNFAHYRNSADYELAIHMIASPTPYAFGMAAGDEPTAIGPTQLWHSTAKDVKVGMLEFTGQGVSTIRVAMRDKKDDMAVLGARLLRSDGAERENVTAETTRLESREETSVLVGATETVEMAFTKALRFAAEWAGVKELDFTVSLNRDFVETRLSPEEMNALVTSWQAGAFGRETLHENLQRGEIVRADRTVEEETAATEQEAADRAEKALEQAEANAAIAAANKPEPTGKPGDNKDDDE